jgi:hypothetical protein
MFPKESGRQILTLLKNYLLKISINFLDVPSPQHSGVMAGAALAWYADEVLISQFSLEMPFSSSLTTGSS